MNTRDLEAFLAVVETGSIVGASARLHLTQPGVSRRIQSLEEQLGVALLDRQTKPLKPTAAGRETYAHGRRVLGVLDDLRTGLSPDGAPRGEFRIGVSPYLSEVGVTALADTLRARFPGLVLRITAGWPNLLLEQIRCSEIDVAAFCLPEGVTPATELQTEKLEVQPVHVVAPASLDLPSPAMLRDLARYPWIFNQDGCGFRSTIKRRFERDQLPLEIGIEAMSSDLRLSLVARGLGITLATKDAVDNSSLREAIRIVALEDFTPRVQAWVVRRTAAGRLEQPIDELTAALRTAIGPSAATTV
jgi:DNA-binding transcriptional LysR family regulator